jgi:hypothetical protein
MLNLLHCTIQTTFDFLSRFVNRCLCSIVQVVQVVRWNLTESSNKQFLVIMEISANSVQDFTVTDGFTK